MIKSTWHRFLGFVWVLAPLQLQYVKHFLSSSSKKFRPSGDFLQAHVWIPLKISVKILKIFPCLVTQNLVLVSNRHRDLGGSSASGTCLTAVQVHHRSPEHTSGPTTSPCHGRASRTERRIFSTIFSGYFQRDIDRDLEWGGDPVAAGKRPVAPSEFRRRAIVNELPSLKTQMSRSEKTCEPDCVPCLKSLSAPHFRRGQKAPGPNSRSRESPPWSKYLRWWHTLQRFHPSLRSSNMSVRLADITSTCMKPLMQMDQN